MNKYTKQLIQWALVAMCLTPVLGWAHGAVDQPVSRAMKCQATGGFWQSTDGSSIVNRGCRVASKATFSTPAEWAFPAQQWNEVAHIPHINNPTLNQIKDIIKDDTICAAGDPKKAALDYPTPYWSKTNVTPGQSLTIRLIGTAPHVPSTFYAFVTRPGFDSAMNKLKWSDLIPLGQPENLTVANTNWQTPPALPGASGFFLISRPIPSTASGTGLIVGIWVRNDPAGEFFISCSDVKFRGGSVPDPVTNIGPFINSDMQAAKPGDKVHFRIFGSNPSKTELVDIIQLLGSSNMGPGQWGKQIADQVDPSVAKIGELDDQTVTFNKEDALLNTTNVVDPGYTQAMSIIPGQGGGNPDPRPPVAVIRAPTTVESGKPITIDGSGSTFYNQGQEIFQWSATHGLTPMPDAPVVTPVAPIFSTPTDLTLYLVVYDGANKTKSPQVVATTRVLPTSGGGNYPQYDLTQLKTYKGGTRVSNKGVDYECIIAPSHPWCTLEAFEPGHSNGNWVNAWKIIP